MNLARPWRLRPRSLALVAAAGMVAGLTLADHSAAATVTTPTTVTQVVRSAWTASPDFPGVAAVVIGPGLRWQAAAGFADRVTRTPLTPQTPFRVASITKTFTAAAILRLAETRRLSLDDPVARHLTRSTLTLLRSGGYDPDRITVRMLLQHTSGIDDYAANPAYQAAVAARPHHRWARTEQLRFAIDHGARKVGPGRVFRYSDTGYILLGEILERVSHASAARAYRALLQFDRLGLDHTYLETLEPPRGNSGERAHQYLAKIDSYGFDPSFDLHGGGGLVSTLVDLARFFRALLGGHVLSEPSSLAAMRGAPAPTRVGQLGLGLFALRLGDETCYGHQGFWGSSVTTCPRSRITIATTVNQADGFEPAANALHAELHSLALAALASKR